MTNVEKKRLGDLVNFKRGYDLPAQSREAGSYPVLSSSGISGYHSKYKAEGEGIVTGRYGTLGKMYYVNEKYWPHNTALYVTSFKGNHPKYIYYLLKCLGRIRTSDKSAVPGVNRNELHEMVVPCVDNKNQQVKIATVLSTLDAKIELNNRINTKLEAMAKTLYDYWFVQFDFPDKNGKPYKSSGGKMAYNEILKQEIPKGWKDFSIPDLLTIKTGKEDANFATENGKYPFFSCADKPLSCNFPVFKGKAILLAGNGNFGIQRFDGEFNAYQRTYVLIPDRDEYYTNIYYVVKDKVKTLTNSSRGSIIKFITKGDIEDIIMPLPVTDGQELFQILNTISKKISTKAIENQQLTQLRDWLLPMLMNSQVTVK